MKLTRRNQLGDLFTQLGFRGEGAEIGVAEGGFSFMLLGHWPGKLHMIDCWEHIPEGYHDGCNVPTAHQEWRFQHVTERAKKYGGRAIIHRAFSLDAVKLFKPGQLDFVYLDGNHSYPAISADLEAWYPIVKPGGVFSGHDYLDGDPDPGGPHSGDYGVKQAVTEFAAKHNLTVNVIPEDWPSWWCIKPK
jgi:hypothetical protein